MKAKSILHTIPALIRYSWHQIITVIKSVEVVRTVGSPVFLKLPTTTGSPRYGEIEASDIKQIKDLEDDSQRLKQMFVDLTEAGGKTC